MFGFSKKNQDVAQVNVLFHEDYSTKEVSESVAGRKGFSLFSLRNMDVPIPDFFVISPNVYKRFVLTSFDKKISKLLEKGREPDSKELEKIIMTSDFEKEVKEDILRCYSRLSGFSNAWVAVRSSVVYPEDPAVTFSGLFHTELSVRGIDQLLEAVKYVYLSMFKDKVILYAKEKGIDLSAVKLAVVVQRMVQPEVSGIAYTVDPITSDNKKMSIEAVFGLGDVIADGSITPDQYILEKKNLDVLEKRISPQEWMRIRKPGDSKVGDLSSFQRIQISNAWSHQQKIEDKYLQDIAKVALIVETKSKKPQLVEWAWESGNVWVLQNKDLFAPIVTDATKELADGSSRSVYDIAIDMIKDEQEKTKVSEKAEKKNDSALQELADKVNEVSPDQVGQPKEAVIDDARSQVLQSDEKDIEQLEKKIDKIEDKKEKILSEEISKKEQYQVAEGKKVGVDINEATDKAEFLLSGIGASNGIVTGQLLSVDSKTDPNIVVTKGNILLVKEFAHNLEKLVMSSGGIVMDGGGLTSDVSIICREVNIPAVVGTGLASALLKDGEFVKIDGNVGSVYKYVVSKEVADKKEVVDKPKEGSSENLADTDDTIKEKVEEIKEVRKEDYKDEKYPTATKVFIMPKDKERGDDYEKYMTNSNGFCYIDLEKLMAEFEKHPLAYVEEKKYKAFSKQIEVIVDDFSDRAKGDEVIVSIGSLSVEELKQLKKGSSYEGKELDSNISGARRLLEEKELLEKEVAIIKKLRNVYKSRNISLAIHAPMNGDVLKKVKREISGLGLSRTGTFKIYAIIGNPAEVILSDEIVKTGIDGIIIDSVSLAMQMQGLSKKMKDPKYDIGANSLWKIIEDLINKVKESKTEIIVYVEDNKKLLQNSIRAGVYGVSVSPKETTKFKKAVSEEETKMILSVVR